MSLVKVVTKYTITELLKVGEKKVRLRKFTVLVWKCCNFTFQQNIEYLRSLVTDQAVRFSFCYETQFAVVFFFLTRIFLAKNSSPFLISYFYSIRFCSEPSLFWRQSSRSALPLNKSIKDYFTRHQKHVYSVINLFFFQKYLTAEPFCLGLYQKKEIKINLCGLMF